MSKNHYVDNKAFLVEITKYRESVLKAKESGSPKPQIPRYVGECFLKIAENYSHKPNFLSYTFRDEMIGDAVENCVRYIDNFDPKVSSNPFAYFSQVTYFAFLRRIKQEKTILYGKYKATLLAGIMDEFELNETDDGTPFRQFELYDNITEFIDNFERARNEEKAKEKSKKIKLENFVEDK